MRGTVKISRPRAEIGFAVVLLAVGLYAQIEGTGYGLGTPGRPGSGAMPFLLGALLCLNALWIAIRDRGSRDETVVFEMRGVTFVVLAMVAWMGATMVLGLLPAIWLLCFVAALGYVRSGPASTLFAALLMSGIAKFLFVDILSVNIPLFRF